MPQPTTTTRQRSDADVLAFADWWAEHQADAGRHAWAGHMRQLRAAGDVDGITALLTACSPYRGA